MKYWVILELEIGYLKVLNTFKVLATPYTPFVKDQVEEHNIDRSALSCVLSNSEKYTYLLLYLYHWFGSS